MEKGGKIVDPVSTAKLYKEWTHLIVEAKKIGLQPNEIREFPISLIIRLRNTKLIPKASYGKNIHRF